MTDHDPSQPMYSTDQLRSIVEAFMVKERQANAEIIAGLKSQVDAMAASMAGTIPSAIPEHSGGIGIAVEQTWSQREQELARAAHEAKLLALAVTPVVETALPFLEGL